METNTKPWSTKTRGLIFSVFSVETHSSYIYSTTRGHSASVLKTLAASVIASENESRRR